MQSSRILCSALLIATAVSPCVAKTLVRHGSSSRKHTTTVATKRVSGQRNIDDARAAQIQTALVKSGYMTEASGHWDAATQSAMQKYQADNGWQTKLMPDSRAIIKLGLGPSQNNAQTQGHVVAEPDHPANESTGISTLSQQ